MPRARKKSPEDTKFDQIAKYLFKGSLTQVRKKFRSHIFQEWSNANPEIVMKALAPPVSSKHEIIEIIAAIIVEREKISLKELTSLLKAKTTIKTQTKNHEPFMQPRTHFTIWNVLVAILVIFLLQTFLFVPIKQVASDQVITFISE